MKKTIILAGIACAGIAANVHSTTIFSENFNSYNNGNLVGQGSWLQTSTIATSPIQVSNGKAIIGTSGQDVYGPFSSPITIPDNSSFYVGLTLNVSAAQATGDYFLHFTPTAGNNSIFPERLYIKASGSGYVLGYLETAGGAGAVVNYGTTVLSFNTDYRTVIAYNAVPGALNDTASVYVNPTDLSNEANNTAYISMDAWGSTSAENSTVAAINFRQGAAGNAPTLTVDDIIVGTGFPDVTPAPVPEPSTFALLGVGAMAGMFVLSRRKS